MTVPVLRLSADSPTTTDAEVLVLGVRAGADGPELLSDDPLLAELGAGLGRLGVRGGQDELLRVLVPGVRAAVALIGVGAAVTADSLRDAAGSAARQLTGAASLAIALPAESAEHTAAVLEGAAVGAYAFTAYRSATLERTKLPAGEITVHGPGEDAAIRRAEAAATAVHTVRDLVATPASDLYPESFASRVVELAEGLPVEIEVLDEAALEAGGYGGLLGVGQGSARGPRLVVVRYAPAEATEHIALVGKGITFDTGGLSLKPAASMVGMKYDMTGAASVLGVVLAAARLGLPTRVTAWLCLAENMPSGTATRPNDVLRIRGGRTVEVLNTDAEGRLVLADGIVAASEEHPDAIVDVATLTGAAKLAMGERVVPIMGDAALAQDIVEAGAAAGEPMWRMPLPPELRRILDSDLADIANAKPGSPAGGMLVAGHFLQTFVGTQEGSDARIPWAHLDIAGAANNGGRGWGSTPRGSTGVAVRSLLEWLERRPDRTADAV
ncbi:leucyl aminopeptidase [Homoserinibacter sp. YIM 151385]|uniref:leucyl aminopeptidase n=1 Tax=Homoserinibacter sp. YIM 151385 TaxID=2985506 RepID=UPI0022F004DF|nr:leucyl aminopeptidase [Homoserinibacter sp. YIM 151385]WBU38487.1 leucyl aminopeptidase [Homoserinibacter sp. YIM 151385]